MTTLTPTERVVEALEAHGRKVRRIGDHWAAQCPAHEDTQPSMSVRESDTGNALVCCHRGCTTADICRELDLTVKDLFPPQAPRDVTKAPGKFKAAYVYTDEQGEPLFRVVRYEPKTFRQERPGAAGGWIPGLGETRRVLYHLPQVVKAKQAGQPVWIVEGEKDVENLEWMRPGLVATCNAMGSEAWKPEYTETLAGTTRVNVIADRDDKGYAHARMVASALLGNVQRIVVAEGIEGKDITDHIRAGRGLQELVTLWDSKNPNDWLDTAPAPHLPEMFIDWHTFWDDDIGGPEWLFEPILAKSRGHAFYAGHKTGKSLVVLAMATQILTTHQDVVVVYMDFEMGRSDLMDRLESMGHGPESDLWRLVYAPLPSLLPLDTREGADEFLGILDNVQAVFPNHHLCVLIDTTSRAVEGDENQADTIRNFYRLTGLRLKQREYTWGRLDHAGKDAEKGQRGTSAKGDDVDVIWRVARLEDGYKLTSIARMQWVPPTVQLRISEDPFRIVVVDGAGVPAGTKGVMDDLDQLQVPVDISVRNAIKMLKESSRGHRSDLVRAAVKSRKEASQSVSAWIGTREDERDTGHAAGHTSQNGHLPGADTNGTHRDTPAESSVSRVPPPRGDTDTDHPGHDSEDTHDELF